MRIAIDCRTILNPGYGEAAGVGHYVYYLVKNILEIDRHNHYILFFDHRLSERAAMQFVGERLKTEIVFFPFGEYKKYLPLAYSHLIVAAAIAEKKPDIFHLPAGVLPLTLKIPSVVTVHDLAIYSHPEWFPKQNFSVKVAYPRTLTAARRLIAVSAATRRELLARFHLPPQRVGVIHPGVDVSGSGVLTEDIFSDEDAVDWSDVSRRYRLGRPYILFLGTIEPRKNVSGLAAAFVAAWRGSIAVRGMELLVAGAPGWSDGGARAAITRAARLTKGAVRAIGYVAAREKFPLMRGARVFVFPSLAEGFGLPVAEALALGRPTVVSDLPVFHELCGAAALYADPNDPAALAATLVRAATDEPTRRRLAAAATKRARRYSWKKTARQTFEIYRQVAHRA